LNRKQERIQELNRQMKLLKFTNARLQCLNKCITRMKLTGHSYKVFGAIIRPNTIKMMSNFIRFQWTTQFLFQYEAMFHHIFITHSYTHISMAKRFATFPPRVIASFGYFVSAMLTHLGLFNFQSITNWTSITFTTVISSFTAFRTKLKMTKLKMAIVNLKWYPTILANKVFHNLNVAHYRGNVKLWIISV